MGTEVSSYDEWIELYNDTPNPISVDGWTFKNADGTLLTNLEGAVLPYDFYLLERTDDNSASGIKADLIYKGTLKNNGEKLELFDSSNNLIDSVDCKSGWTAGDNKTKQTMERSFQGDWNNSQKAGGSPKAKNSEAQPPSLLEEEKELSHDSSIEERTIYPSGIIFNEILPSPEGEDAEEEWFELLNRNTFEVDLSGWKISDVSGKITAYTLPERTKIIGGSFLVFYRPTTKIILNNDGDGLRLSNPNGDIIDEIIYEKASPGQSYSLFEGKWRWSIILTPGDKNLEKNTLGEKNEEGVATQKISKNDLAAIEEQIPASSKLPSFPAFLISFILAFLSGAIILFVKKLQQSKNLLQ